MNNLRSKFEQNLGRWILALLFLGCLLVVWPFVTALIWATVLSFCTWPLYGRLTRFLGGRRTLAAAALSLSIVLAVILPLAIVGLTLGDNVTELKTATQRWAQEGLPPAPAWLVKVPLVGRTAEKSWNSMATDKEKLAETAKAAIEKVGALLLKGGLRIGAGLAQLAVSILLTFFFLKQGAALAGALTDAIQRIGGRRGTFLLELAGNTVRGVVYGILGTALVQALMAAFGLLIAGVPGVGLLALLTFFLSVVPGGPPLILVPAALWLFHQGSSSWGIFMLIWAVAVSTIDNFVKPWLISKGSDMPLILILFGVLGGAMAFGFIGVFIGPTLLALGYRIVQEWSTAGGTALPGGAETAAPLHEELATDEMLSKT